MQGNDDELTELLVRLGWSSRPGRTIEHVIEVLRERGYSVSLKAREFIEDFDGFTFTYPKHPAVGGEDTTVLDASRAAGAIDVKTVHTYERRVGQKLCPVGLAGSNHIVLMVSQSGEVYGGYDSFLARYGENGRHAIWNIVHRVSLPRVPDSGR